MRIYIQHAICYETKIPQSTNNFFFIFLGGGSQNLGAMDGISLWNALSNNETSPRTQMLHNIDDRYPNAAVRVGDYKLVKGNQRNNAIIVI